jgi:hypothetical protein
MASYAREGTRHVWPVDAALRTRGVFRLLSARPYEELAVWRGDELVRAEPLDAIELQLSSLWER